MALPAGKLNRRVTLRKQTDMPAMGAAITQMFVDVSTVWANVEPVGNAIFFGTEQVGQDVTHRIIVRRQAGLITEQLITANHVVDQVIDTETFRYRVRRASDLKDERAHIMLEVELLGHV